MSLSPIEALPVEILQDIFVRSLNLDLPLSSPHIASKLSGAHCYLAACFEYLYTPIGDRIRQSRLQSRIFASRWMTWQFFQIFVTKAYEAAGCVCGQHECEKAIWPPDFANPKSMQFSIGHLTRLSYIKCRIPPKLLHGPWTEEKVQFLRYLVCTTSMTVDWADREVRKIALQGKKEAILERNYEAVELFNHNRRLGKAPTIELVRFAVLDGGCDRSIVYDIMASARSWGYRDWDDEALDKWVEQAIAHHNPKGKWLKLKLSELRRQGGFLGPHTGDYSIDGDELVVKNYKACRVSEIRPRFSVRN